MIGRHSDEIQREAYLQGVPQGDSMSSFLFAAATSVVLRQIKDQARDVAKCETIAFADDMLVAFKPLQEGTDAKRRLEIKDAIVQAMD